MKQMNLKIAILFLVIGLILQSCIYPATKSKKLDCSVPPIECKPYRFSPGDFDYSKYIIKQIDDFRGMQICQITFAGKNIFITQSAVGKHLFYNSNQTAVDKFTLIEKGRSTAKYYGLAASAGQRLIYSQLPDENQSADSSTQSNLMEYIYDETYISKPTTLNYLKQSKYEWQSHPALTPDGKILFFASDRSGGEGGIDIWYSMLNKNGTWSAPRNCGAEINTPCDDESPYVADNKLLFASRGHAGLGGFDLFSADIYYDGNIIRFGNAQNMGPQINTAANEIFPSAPGNIDSLLYFSRNTGDDFEMFYRVPTKNFGRNIAEVPKKISEPQKETRKTVEEFDRDIPKDYAYFGEVYSQSDLTPIPNANININNTANDTIIKLVADRKGKFNLRLKKGLNYNVSAHSDNYFYDMEQAFIAKTDKLDNIEQKFYLPKIAVLRINFPSDVYDKPYDFVLDTNGAITSRTWENEIAAATRDINLAISLITEIIITGYTDTTNSTPYNYQLGLKRANFVKSQLIKNGVPANLITVKSMGESNPLPQKPDEPAEIWGQRLRRVTISKVMGK